MAHHPRPIATDEIVDYWTYLASIDWTEPWLVGLIIGHLTTTLSVITLRHNYPFQVCILLTLLILATLAETLNAYAAQHWRLFSREQYFDSNGMFMVTVFSFPILFNCMVIIGTWLYMMTQMMITLGRLRVKERMQKQKEQGQSKESATAETSPTDGKKDD